MSDGFVGFPAFGSQRLRPGWLISGGIFLLALGLLAWTDVVFTTLASMVVLGVLMIMAGVAQILQAVAHRHGPMQGYWLAGLIGALYVLAGILMIEEPANGSVFLTALLAGCLIFAGVSRAAWAFGHRGYGTWWTAAFSGLFTLLIGILLYVTLPWSGLTIFGTLIAVELVCAGIAAIVFGFSLRRTSS